jgi:hypothetical protein
MKSPHHNIPSLVSRLLAITMWFQLCTSLLFGQTPTFVSFDAPGAGTGVSQGTIPAAINLKGQVAGIYIDSSNLHHGFVRQTNGQFTEFSPPSISNVVVIGINSSGEVLGTGTLSASPFDFYPFLRSPTGQYTAFAALQLHASSTQPTGINNGGQVSGFYQDASQAYHGFLRDASGNFTVIDDPDANTSAGDGTFALAINDNGVVAGYYGDKTTGKPRGFVRDQFGNFTDFDVVPGGSDGVVPVSINLSGEIAGEYWGSNQIFYGFLRDAVGNITTFSVPDALFTHVVGMNDSGLILGEWSTPQNYDLGYLRDAAGNITTFSVPLPNYANLPSGINANGKITGSWEGQDFVLHGFIQ